MIEPVEAQVTGIGLVERNRDNLSLYNPEEEIAGLRDIGERLGLSVVAVPVNKDGKNLGYAVFAADPKKQAEIWAEAPITFLDFDDTQAKTTAMKQVCWRKLEALGIPAETIRLCDKMARVKFDPVHGEIYEPELDMRLLTLAREFTTEDLMGIQLESHLARILGSESASQAWKSFPVDEEIRQIFMDTRYSVESYPDTVEVMRKLRGDGDLPSANVITLTYGDCLFQFEKTVGSLKSDEVQMILLTKAKKGEFLEALFNQNPFKDMGISYRYDEVKGKGILPQEYMMPMVVMDDDPKQVSSLQEMAQRLGIPLLALWRQWSEEHKRASVRTPEGQLVEELTRLSEGDDSGRIEQDIAEKRDKLYAFAIETMIMWAYDKWLSEVSLLYAIKNGRDVAQDALANPRANFLDFMRDCLDKDQPYLPGFGDFVETAARYRYPGVDIQAAFLDEKKHLVEMAHELVKKRFGKGSDGMG